MGTDKRLYSDLPIPPGEYLAEVLGARGISQAELARRIGRPTQAINEIIKGEKAIIPATALQLERALDVPAHIWTGLEARYQLIKARSEERKQLQKEAAYLPRTPYKELAELNCVERTRDTERKVRELQRFYGVSSLANLPAVRAYAALFRLGTTKDASAYALAAWLRCAEMRAREAKAGTFDRPALRAALRDIRRLTVKGPDEFVPELERQRACPAAPLPENLCPRGRLLDRSREGGPGAEHQGEMGGRILVQPLSRARAYSAPSGKDFHR